MFKGRYLYESKFSFLRGKYPRVKLLSNIVIVRRPLKEIDKPFSRVAVSFYISTSCECVIQFLQIPVFGVVAFSKF